MAFQVSPGSNISEIDLTTIVPSISTTEGAIAGVFPWGPIGKYTLVDSENTLASRYGRPDNNTYETFFVSADFLSYGKNLYVSRAATVSGGYSNTLTTQLNSNTTAVVSSNAAVNGLSGTLGVYGEGVDDGTTATFSSNSTATVVTLSANATSADEVSLNFFDTAYSFNACANSSAAPTRASHIIKNSDHFDTVTVPSGIEYVARYPGALGNSLKISVVDNTSQYGSTINPYDLEGYTNTSVIPGSAGLTLAVNETAANVYISNSATLDFSTTYTTAGVYKGKFTVGDYVEVGNSSIGKQYLKIKTIGDLANTGGGSPTGEVTFPITFEEPYKLSTAWAANTVARHWEWFNVVSATPGTSDELTAAGSVNVDQVSVVVEDQDGKFSGTPGTILEVYQNLSRATDAKNEDGTTNYYKTVINSQSNYVWVGNDRTTAASNTAALVANSSASVPLTVDFVGGRDGTTESNIAIGDLTNAYDLYNDSTSVDVSLIMTGKSRGGTNGEQLANYIVDNIAEVRKDCVVYVSPERADVVNASGSEATNVNTFRDSLRSSSYQFIDSGYKYTYDKYNDVYRYVPLNGDTAGVTARTDQVSDPWFSPAGFNRGQIKNIVKLAWNPNKAERDLLYKNGVNPVVTFPGQGTVLFGDKTGLAKSSAFNRINVRRLFIILEKTVAIAAQSTLFEFNDDFTRAQFRNLIEPFLRDIKGRRGIYDFQVVCDDTNNTPEVIDGNRFVGDIYIKPAKSINFIQLNFSAVRSNVEFNEIVGRS